MSSCSYSSRLPNFSAYMDKTRITYVRTLNIVILAELYTIQYKILLTCTISKHHTELANCFLSIIVCYNRNLDGSWRLTYDFVQWVLMLLMPKYIVRNARTAYTFKLCMPQTRNVRLAGMMSLDFPTPNRNSSLAGLASGLMLLNVEQYISQLLKVPVSISFSWEAIPWWQTNTWNSISIR